MMKAVTALVEFLFKQRSTLVARNLRCEYLVDPLAIATTQPRLSWLLEPAAARGQKQQNEVQTAYQITAGTQAGKSDLWDSGKVISNQTSHVVYSGKTSAVVFWRVRVWNKNNSMSRWSRSATWEAGAQDWQAAWITLDSAAETAGLPLLRKTFTIPKIPKRGRAHVTALGLYELRINGQRVGDAQLTPGWTDYEKRLEYQSYDITPYLQKGENVIAVLLGDGWYLSQIGWMELEKKIYGSRPPKLLLQLELDEQLVVSDASWKATNGHILSSDLLAGEVIDARQEPLGWDTVGFDDTTWQPATVVQETSQRKIVTQKAESIRITEELPFVSVREVKPNVFLFDIGQNIVGWVRLTFQAPTGTTITLRHSEILTPDGELYTENLRTAKATDQYIARGTSNNDTETFEPRFTFHGFRYVEVSGLTTIPQLTACVVHSDMTPTGSFECSNPLINRLQKNITWSQRGNFLSIPTDCPQRDERLGWMGDAQVFAATAAFNYDAVAFFTKWLTDVSDAQGSDGAYSDVAPRVPHLLPTEAAPGWGDAGVIIPWTLYQLYGDTKILEEHYDSMTRWIEHVKKNNPNHLWANATGNNYGDWLAPFPAPPENEPTIKTICATAWYAHSVDLLARTASVLQKTTDTATYNELFEQIKTTFNNEFVKPDGRITGDWQTCYVLALRFNLLTPEIQPLAAEHLSADIVKNRDNHLNVGFMGAPHLMPALTAAGHLGVNYQLLLQETFPSWLYPIINADATTVWERWDSWKDGKFENAAMNSFNHYAYGSIGEWLYATIGGISALEPGYKKILIRPQPGGDITWAKTTYESINGSIHSAWKIEQNTFILNATIPVNTTAVIQLPSGVSQEIGSGTYEFIEPSNS